MSNLSMAYNLKKMNHRKKMAEGGEVKPKEKSIFDKFDEWAGNGPVDPKTVKDPIDMRVGKHQFEPVKKAEGGMIEERSKKLDFSPEEAGEIMPAEKAGEKAEEQEKNQELEASMHDMDMVQALLHKRKMKMMAHGGMAEDESMPVDLGTSHDDFLSDEDEESAHVLAEQDGAMSRKGILKRLMSSIR